MSIRINVGAKFDARDIQRARRELDALAKQGDSTSARMQRLGSTMQSVGKSMQSVGRTMTRNVSMPIAALGGLAVKSAMDFETSFAKIEGLVGVSADEIGALQEAARTMGPAVGVSANEAAEALFFITSAGLRGSEAIEALESSLKASAIGLGDTATVADLVTSAVNAFGSATLGASEATDVLTMAVRLGKLAPDELAGSIGMVLPLASAMGVTFNDVGAAFAAMSRTGTDASTAATQLRQILSALQKPTVDADKQLEELGLTASGLRQELREKGLLSVLTTLTNSFGDNETAAARVFGNIRALSGVLDLMGSNVEATNMVFGGMSDVIGVSDDALGKMTDTAQHKFNVALATLRETLRGVGETMLPFFKRFVDGLTRMAEKFESLSDGQQKFITAALAIIALAGPLIIFFGMLLASIGAITIALGKMSIATALATGGLSLLVGGIAVLAFKSMADDADAATRAIELQGQAAEHAAAGNHALADSMYRQADALQKQSDFAQGHKAMADFRKAEREQIALSELLGAELEVVAEATEEVGIENAVAGPKVVKLTRHMRDLLQGLNETNVGTGKAGDSIAQFSRELLAAGQITDDTAAAATRLAQVVRQDIDAALAKGNKRLDEARQKFEQYRDAISGGVRRGNTLTDAVGEQTNALEALTRAEEEYESAVASKDVERIAETDKALKAARKGQTGFLGFLQTGLDTAEGFAAQIESLRLAGASMDVVRQIAELGATTGGRVISELMSGGAEAIEQANRLVAAVEEASVRAGVAAADQFHSAGIRSAKQFIAAVEATIPELQTVLDKIADMIEKALGVRPKVDITGRTTFIEPTITPARGGTPAFDKRVLTEQQARDIAAVPLSAFKNFTVPGLAAGGVVTSPTFAMIGEAGPEAVIPLGRGGFGGNTINITVTSADPQAVVEALRRYTRSNGPLGQVVSV